MNDRITEKSVTDEGNNEIKLSVYLIVRNEEKNIRTALESVKWADEIVIVDSGSVDNTVKIAREYGAKIFDEEFRGYTLQKNSAMGHCSGQWLLNIDADEEVSDDLRKSIEFIIFQNNIEKVYDSYKINRKNFYLGKWIKHCGWYPEYRIRLSQRGSSKWVGETLHEKLESSGESGFLKGDLLHRPYENLGVHLDKIRKYSEIWAEKEVKNGRKSKKINLFSRPAIRFIKMFILKAGFLDGMPGLIASIMGSYYVFMKYARLYEIDKVRN